MLVSGKLRFVDSRSVERLVFQLVDKQQYLTPCEGGLHHGKDLPSLPEMQRRRSGAIVRLW